MFVLHNFKLNATSKIIQNNFQKNKQKINNRDILY